MKSPFRWVGGKTRLLPIIREYLPPTAHNSHPFNNYFEPMMGGGALFFDYGFEGRQSYLMDINKPLMAAYEALRDDYLATKAIVMANEGRDYNDIRRVFNDEKRLALSDLHPVRLGSLFITLNHLCYNGVYRENLSGGFNVPQGSHGTGPKQRPRTLASLDWGSLASASVALAGAQLAIGSCLEWPAVWPHPGLGDVVFYDPPYAGEFSDYDATRFTLDHHRALHQQAQGWADNGASVIVCGSNNEWSWKVYGKPTRVIDVRRTVGNSLRGDATEALYVFVDR